MPPFLYISTAVLLPVAAFLMQKWALHPMSILEPPPPDFGTGQMFDTIAARYDFVNRVLALGMDMKWRKRMVQSIQQHLETMDLTERAPRVLDLATGTADVAILLAQTIPYATIEGVDPSSNMLERGRAKVQSHKNPSVRTNISLHVQDAQNLIGLESNAYDAATMAFGIRNVPNRPHALCEIHRVMKPSSLFCILEFSEPDDSFGLLGRVARVFIRHVVPTVGGLLSGAPREYWHLQNSIQDFPSPREFVQLLNQLPCQHQSSQPSFKVQDLVQLNFGSVQLYVTKVLKRDGDDESTSLKVSDDRHDSHSVLA